MKNIERVYVELRNVMEKEMSSEKDRLVRQSIEKYFHIENEKCLLVNEFSERRKN